MKALLSSLSLRAQHSRASHPGGLKAGPAVLPSMRSGAEHAQWHADAKAEVSLERPVPLKPQNASALAVGPSPSGWT